MKKILIVMLLVIILCGCNKEEKTDYKYSSNPQVEKIMQEGNYIIVDVRTQAEYEETHLKEAINIPYDEINENTVLDKSKTILVYCRSGNRSAKAYNTLQSLGYNVYDLGAIDNIDLPKE